LRESAAEKERIKNDENQKIAEEAARAEQIRYEEKRAQSEAARLKAIEELRTTCERKKEFDACRKLAEMPDIKPSMIAYRVTCSGESPSEDMCRLWFKRADQEEFGKSSSAARLEAARAGCKIKIGSLCAKQYTLESKQALRQAALGDSIEALVPECNANLPGSCDEIFSLSESCNLRDKWCKEIKIWVFQRKELDAQKGALVEAEKERQRLWRQEAEERSRRLDESLALQREQLNRELQMREEREERERWRDIGNAFRDAFPPKKQPSTSTTKCDTNRLMGTISCTTSDD
jgi:hypothetical protein